MSRGIALAPRGRAMSLERRTKMNTSARAGGEYFAPSSRVFWGALFLFWLALGVLSAGSPFIQFPPVRRTVPPAASPHLILRMFASHLIIFLACAAVVSVGVLV